LVVELDKVNPQNSSYWISCSFTWINELTLHDSESDVWYSNTQST